MCPVTFNLGCVGRLQQMIYSDRRLDCDLFNWSLWLSAKRAAGWFFPLQHFMVIHDPCASDRRLFFSTEISVCWSSQTHTQPLTLQLLIRDYANCSQRERERNTHKSVIIIIKLCGSETQPCVSVNPSISISIFCFLSLLFSFSFLFLPPFFLSLSLCLSLSVFFFFPPRRVLLGTCEWQPMGGLRPLSLLSASLTSNTARSDAARLRRAAEVEQRATHTHTHTHTHQKKKAAVNGYTVRLVLLLSGSGTRF